MIFWMDMWIEPFGNVSWTSGSTYFANINRSTGKMAGILISNAGGLAVFSGQKL